MKKVKLSSAYVEGLKSDSISFNMYLIVLFFFCLFVNVVRDADDKNITRADTIRSFLTRHSTKQRHIRRYTLYTILY